jgi:hypothetical protein
MFHKAQVSRRAVLQGLGVSLALPWLESLRASPALAAAASVGGTPPKRMAFLFVPNGVHMQDWTPRATGHGFQLPYVLEPLADVQEDLLVLTGLTHDKGRANGDGPGDHARSASVFLTGAQPRKTSGADIRSGVSVDQWGALALGSATRFPSLQLGCERGRSAGNCDSGYSCAYSSNISWAGEASPLAAETNPRAVFDRLFSSASSGEADAQQAQREALKKSILDYVADDAQRLKAQLGRNDQRKLDEYLTGVREIERRLDRSEQETVQSGLPNFRVPDGVPREYAEHIQLMNDMIVLAFQADLTRIASFMLANAGSNRSYKNLEISEGHHELSHHGGDPKKHAKIRQINRFHVSQLAHLLKRLKSIPEGEGTLLDNCMIVYGSGLSDGNRHNHDNLPILVAGRGGGTIDTGRHLRYELETPVCNLFLSLLDRFGAPAPFLGDSTGRLTGLQL